MKRGSGVHNDGCCWCCGAPRARNQGGKKAKTRNTPGYVTMPFASIGDVYPSQEVRDTWSKVEAFIDRPAGGVFQDVVAVAAFLQSLCPWQPAMGVPILVAAITADANPRRCLTETLPGIVRLAAELAQMPLLMNGIENLICGRRKSICLPKPVIASLLANAFLCTFPLRNSKAPDQPYANFPTINFAGLYMNENAEVDEIKKQKLKCLLQYFKTRLQMSQEVAALGDVTYTKVFLASKKKVNWSSCARPVKRFVVQPLDAKLDDAHEYIEVVFSKPSVGGGVLGKGCLQEEIKFISCPELIVARLFTEKLAEDEALVIKGVQQYVETQGFQNSFKFLGPSRGLMPAAAGKILVATNFAKAPVIGTSHYDALFHKFRQSPDIPASVTDKEIKHFISMEGHTLDQYTEPVIVRELDEAYAGYVCNIKGISSKLAVASGDWGGGAQKGDSFLKGILQHLAASAAGRNFLYLPSADAEELVQTAFADYDMEGKPVAAVYSEVLEYAEDMINVQISTCPLAVRPSLISVATNPDK